MVTIVNSLLVIFIAGILVYFVLSLMKWAVIKSILKIVAVVLVIILVAAGILGTIMLI